MNLLAPLSHGISVAELAATVLVQTTAVVLIAALVAHVVLRRSPAGRHAVWLGALVYVLASPLLAYTSRGTGFAWLTIPVFPTEAGEPIDLNVTPTYPTSLPQSNPRRGPRVDREPAAAQSGLTRQQDAERVVAHLEAGARSAWKTTPEGVVGRAAGGSASAHTPGLHSVELRKPAAPLSMVVGGDGSESLVAGKPEGRQAGPAGSPARPGVGPRDSLSASTTPGLSSRVAVLSEPPRRRTARSRFGGLLAGSILSVWSLGMVVLAARLLHGWRVLASLRRAARPVAGGAWEGLLARVRQTLDVRELPQIASSSAVASPMAAGVFRPVVLLPEGALRIHRDGLHDVLVHECAHVLRHDHLVGLAQRVAEMIFWLHPPVHYLNRQLSQAREEVCDNYVLRRGDAPGYARTLLELTEQFQVLRRSPVGVGLMTPRWKLEHRVAGLLNTRRNRMARTSKRTTIGVVAGFALLGIALMGVRLVSATEEETAAPKASTDQKEAVPAPVPDPAPGVEDGTKPADNSDVKETTKDGAAKNVDGRKKDQQAEQARRAEARELEIQKRIRMRVENEIRPLLAELENEIERNQEPGVDALDEDVEKKVESTLERLQQILERDLGPALEKLGTSLDRELTPAIETLGKNLGRELKPAIEKLGADFQRDFAAAFKNFGTNFERELRPALEKLGEDLERDLRPALENLSAEIERELKPALEDLGEEILEAVEHELEDIGIEFDQGAPAPVPVPDAPKVEPGDAQEPPGGADLQPNVTSPTVNKQVTVLSANQLLEFENRVERTFAVREGGRLTVEVDRGDVGVEAVDGENVSIEVVRKVRAETREQADAILEHHDVQFLPSGNDIRVVAKWNVAEDTKTELPGFERERQLRGFSYRIKVPHQYNVDLKTAGGHVSVSDLNGEVRTQTDGGHLNLGNITGTVWARTKGGHIKLAGGGGSADVHTDGGHITIGDVNGEVIAQTAGGHIHIGRAKGNVVAKTSGGHIHIEDVPGQVDATTSGGNVEVTISEQPQADCRVSTSAGNVTLRLAEGIRATVDAKTGLGRVHADLSNQPDDGSKKSISLDLNGGGPKLVLRTGVGNVRLSLIPKTAAVSDQ